MLDDFYPRALQWCSTDDIPDNVVIVDISNSYPNVLLNDTHNTFAQYLWCVENFNCKSDREKFGEFYIDETVINYYTHNYRSRFLQC